MFLDGIKVIEFTHSIPLPRPKKILYPFSLRYCALENAIFAYPTVSGLKALSNQYNMPIENCVSIYNCLSILDDLDESVKILSNQVDILSPDILTIYPARLTTGKKHEKIALLLGSIKKATNKNVKIIFADFSCTDTNPTIYKKQIIDIGLKNGLSKDDIVFTSDFGFTDGFPRSGVLDLFSLSNLFVCPSFSESFGLTIIEAASRGNFIVVNKKVPALLELGTNLDSYFMCWDALNFGYQTKENYHPTEEEYNLENAIIISKEIDKNTVLSNKTKIRKEYSTDWVFKNQLLPLLKEK